MLVRMEAGHGTTRESGYDVGQSGGRPHSTTQEAGYDVGQSGGRPHGTTQAHGPKGRVF